MSDTQPMNIRRDFSANAVNAVLNNPEVRPWVADMGEGAIDLTRAVANTNNILLMGEFGGCMFYRIMDGMYEVHTQVLPEGRGQWVKDFLMAVRHFIWTRTDAIEVTTRVPHGHEGAKRAAEFAGMTYEFTRPDCCRFRGADTPVDIYSERIQDWTPKAPFLVDKGEWLHKQMVKEAKRVGIKEKPHDDDENHNRYVGAALEMMRGGQFQKAVAFYNRWAVASRHATIKLISVSPPTIQFDVGSLKFDGNKVEIIPWPR